MITVKFQLLNKELGINSITLETKGYIQSGTACFYISPSEDMYAKNKAGEVDLNKLNLELSVVTVNGDTRFGRKGTAEGGLSFTVSASRIAPSTWEIRVKVQGEPTPTQKFGKEYTGQARSIWAVANQIKAEKRREAEARLYLKNIGYTE